MQSSHEPFHLYGILYCCEEHKVAASRAARDRLSDQGPDASSDEDEFTLVGPEP